MGKQWIESNPDMMLGKPVVRGTRITVEALLESLGAGESIDDLLASHPRLTREGVQAALTFAAQALKADVIYPTSDEAA